MLTWTDRCAYIHVSRVSLPFLLVCYSPFGISSHLEIDKNILAATKQLQEPFCPPVRPSVRLSVTSFAHCSPHRIIITFSGVITIAKSEIHDRIHSQRLKVKVTEVKTNFAPVWAFPDSYSILNSQMVTK